LPEQQAFGTFATPDELARGLGSECESTRCSARKAMRSIQHVNTFLSGWTGSQEYLYSRKEDIAFIGFQKTLDADFERLKQLFDLPKTVRLPQDTAKKHKTPGSEERRLSQPAERQLHDWYKRDYAILDACRQIASEKNAALQAKPAS